MATTKKKTPAKTTAKKSATKKAKPSKYTFSDAQKSGLWLIITVLVVLVAVLFFYCSYSAGA